MMWTRNDWATSLIGLKTMIAREKTEPFFASPRPDVRLITARGGKMAEASR